MAASSLSLAAAALPTSSHSLSTDHFSLNFFPCKPNLVKTPSKLKTALNYSLSYSASSFSRSSIHCASTAFDGIDLNQEELVVEEEEGDELEEEEEPSNGVQGSVSEAEEPSSFADAGRLYVGNLPFSMPSAELCEIFAEAGRVVSVDIVYDRVTDRSRGFGFVTMGSVAEAKEAIRLFNGAQIGGRTAKVNFPDVPRGNERVVMDLAIRNNYQSFVDSPHKLYAGNLSWSLTSQSLREAFAEHPGFLSAKIIFDRESGRSRGYGFITFSSAEEVESALNAMNGVEMEGRPLRLNLANQRAPASPPREVPENSEVFSSANA